MVDAVLNEYWFPEELAARWEQLPKRLGYRIEPLPSYILEWWMSGVKDVSREMVPSKVEGICRVDRSAVIITGGTVMRLLVEQDQLGAYDSTRSYWAELWMARDDSQPEYATQVEYHRDHSNLAIYLLNLAFLSSGAQMAEYDNGSKRRVVGCDDWGLALFRCTTTFATQWYKQLLDQRWGCRLIPACPAPYPPLESYVAGRITKIFGGVHILAGPAFDSKWQDSAFFAVGPFGRLPPYSLASIICDRAVRCGAVALHCPPWLGVAADLRHW